MLFNFFYRLCKYHFRATKCYYVGDKINCIQGDPYGRGKDNVDIKFVVLFQYKPLVLKRNFKIAINKKSFTTIGVSLYSNFTPFLSAVFPGDRDRAHQPRRGAARDGPLHDQQPAAEGTPAEPPVRSSLLAKNMLIII